MIAVYSIIYFLIGNGIAFWMFHDDIDNSIGKMIAIIAFWPIVPALFILISPIMLFEKIQEKRTQRK